MDEDNSAFPEEKKNCPVTVQLTAGEKKQLQTLAANRGTSQSAVARKYITQAMSPTVALQHPLFTPGELLPLAKEEEKEREPFFWIIFYVAWMLTLIGAFFLGKAL